MMSLLFILSIAVAAVALLFVAVDLAYGFGLWQSRIHIGRCSDETLWHNMISRKASRWLSKTPVVPVRASERLILLDILRGRRRTSVIQSWQTAGLILGLGRSGGFRLTAPQAERIVRRYAATDAPDKALLAYALLTAPACQGAEAAVGRFAHATFEMLMRQKGSGTTIPYRAACPELRFVDTLGFVCPFLTAYGLKYGDRQAIELARQQLQEYVRLLHPVTKLPPHAYNLATHSPLGVYDWGRGTGWYILALTECLCQAGHDDRGLCGDMADTLRRLILDLAPRLAALQRADGGFAAFICNPGGGGAESSATALCGLLFESAFAVGGDSGYADAAARCRSRLMASTRRDGALDFCQGDTMGIGYYSHDFNIMPFAQGMALALSSQLLRK